MANRSPAQRAAYARLLPKTEVFQLATFIDPALVGAELWFPPLGVVIQYGYSFTSPADGKLYHAGTVRRRAPDCGIKLGCHWAWRAEEWRRVNAPAN